VCGIAGAWSDHPGHTFDLDAAVTRMSSALAHRGPDGNGLQRCSREPDVVLGHRRLSILDLSERGAQPMKSDRAPVWLTYNGEIYNFRDLRRELEQHGRRFRSDSDTEVILQGYEEWGDEVLRRLRGMFALAIWDGRTSELLIARDRLGVKPLYVYHRGGVLLFASEVRALLASGLVPRQLDHVALDQYLAYQTVPTPRTLVAGVRMLEPGSLLRVGALTGSPREAIYWDLLDDAVAEAAEVKAPAARVRVRELLVESAELHQVSDVPVGIFLSGGIDSSAIAALTREAGATPRTFSVVLPGSRHDEGPFARMVAKRLSADHTEISLTENDFRDELPSALQCVDHPSGDGLNTFVVSRAVRAAGIKVALSGLGGDELFGGYPSFARMKRLQAYGALLRKSPMRLRTAAAAVVRKAGGASVAATKAAAVLETDGSVARAFPVLRQLFGDAERDALVPHRAKASLDPYVALLEGAAARYPHMGTASFVSYGEARTYMHDVLLRDTDQMSMAHGLEARVPLLDHRLVEYVMGLPDEVKDAGGMPKQLLVDVVRDSLPPECVNRPKQGFVLPFDSWMKTDLRGLCEAHLYGPAGLATRGLFDRGAVERLWQRFLAGDAGTSWSRPWALVALNAWLDQNGIDA